jgi:hypothetical protein
MPRCATVQRTACRMPFSDVLCRPTSRLTCRSSVPSGVMQVRLLEAAVILSDYRRTPIRYSLLLNHAEPAQGEIDKEVMA